MTQVPYKGPAAIVLTPAEVRLVLDALTALADADNAALRQRLREYLERDTE